MLPPFSPLSGTAPPPPASRQAATIRNEKSKLDATQVKKAKQKDEEDWMLREANRVQTNALQSAKEKANDTHYTEVRFPSNPFNREIIPPRARFPPAALSSLVASPPAGFGPITVEKR